MSQSMIQVRNSKAQARRYATYGIGFSSTIDASHSPRSHSVSLSIPSNHRANIPNLPFSSLSRMGDLPANISQPSRKCYPNSLRSSSPAIFPIEVAPPAALSMSLADTTDAKSKPPNPKTFLCRICQKGFTQAGNRTRHEKTVHADAAAASCPPTSTEPSPSSTVAHLRIDTRDEQEVQPIGTPVVVIHPSTVPKILTSKGAAPDPSLDRAKRNMAEVDDDQMEIDDSNISDHDIFNHEQHISESEWLSLSDDEHWTDTDISSPDPPMSPPNSPVAAAEVADSNKKDDSPSRCISPKISHDIPEAQIVAADSETTSESDFEDEEMAHLDLSKLAGMPQPLSEKKIAKLSNKFLRWLSQPARTPAEKLVKQKRLKNDAQLDLHRRNLRFIFRQVVDHGLFPNGETEVSLAIFEDEMVCHRFLELLVRRKVRSSRIYQLFLLIKKILVQRSSVRSAREQKYIQPLDIASFTYVDSICADASEQYKRSSLNRQLGVGQGEPEFSVPMMKSGDLDSSSDDAEEFDSNGDEVNERKRKSPEGERTQPAHSRIKINHEPPIQTRVPQLQMTAAAAASSAYQSQPMEDISPAAAAASSSSPLQDQLTQTMSKEELQIVAVGCLDEMANHEAKFHQTTQRENWLRSIAADFTDALVTALLCFTLAPRAQVLKELQIGSTLQKRGDGRWWIEMPAELNKNRKPTLLPIPPELTSAMDFYIAHVRPALLRAALQKGAAPSTLAHTYLFVKHNGSAPRADFGSQTKRVTKRLLGREISPHTFRKGVVTTFHDSEHGHSQSSINQLAQLMAHDPRTAVNHYYRPNYAQTAVQTTDHMASMLLQSRR